MPHSIEREGTLAYTVGTPDAPEAPVDPLGPAAGGGSGPGARPVLLVHGFGSSYAMNWAAPGWPWALRAYATRTIGVDLRGHGASVKPHVPAAYSPDALVGDLVAVLDAEGVERADVIGYSLGARLTWELARRHPARVRRAVLGGFGPRPLTEADDDAFGDALEFAAQLPGNDIDALRACAKGQTAHPFSRADGVPEAPLLFVAGADDSLAEGVEDLAAPLPDAPVLRLQGRDHRTAVSSREFKTAAVRFLAAGAPSGGGAG